MNDIFERNNKNLINEYMETSVVVAGTLQSGNNITFQHFGVHIHFFSVFLLIQNRKISHKRVGMRWIYYNNSCIVRGVYHGL